MIDLPSWQPPSVSGVAIPKPSRFVRVTKKAAKKQAETVEIQQAIKPKRKGIGARLRAMVFERDGHACVLCHTRGSTENPLQIGHITPVCQGGENTEENTRVECRLCNIGGGGRKRSTPVDPNRIVQQLAAIVGKKKKN